MEAGLGLDWLEVPAALAFLFADDGEGSPRPLTNALVPDEGGRWLPPAGLAETLRPNETLVGLFSTASSLLELHPLVDLARLPEARVLPEVSECRERLGPEGRLESPFPADSMVYEALDGSLQLMPEPRAFIERAGRLGLVLSGEPCDSGLSARRFGSSWSVTAETLTLGGSTYRRGLEADAHAFLIYAAQYLEDDRLILSSGHGIFVLGRGEVLSDDRGPFYFPVSRVPDEPAESMGFNLVLVQPMNPAPGVKRVVAGITYTRAQRRAARLAVFDLDEDGIELVRTTSIAGEIDDLDVDADGRVLALVTGEDAAGLAGRLVLVHGAESRFERWVLPRSFRDVDGTGLVEPKHWALGVDGKVIVGDLAQPETWRELRSDVDTGGALRGLAAIQNAEDPSIAIGHTEGKVLFHRLNGDYLEIPVFLDDQVRASNCFGSPNECGVSGLASSPTRLWAARDERGPMVAVASVGCQVVVAARPETGCFGLLEVGQRLSPVDRLSAITGIYGTPGFEPGLVAGMGGLVYELILAR